MTERGFKYDELTEADDATVERSRPNLHAAPCGHGVWVSVRDGTVYEGHGGNEREQWYLQERGPWVRLANREFLSSTRRDAAREALDSYIEYGVQHAQKWSTPPDAGYFRDTHYPETED